MPRFHARTIPLLATGLATLVLALACGSGEPSLDQRVVAEIQAMHPQLTVEITGPDELTVTGPDELELALFLDNLRLGCDADPDACDELIDRRVRSLTDHEGASTDAAQLRPVLKHAEYLVQADRYVAESEDPEAAAASTLLRSPWQGELYVVWVLDRPDSMAMVAQGDLEDLGLTREAMEAKALANLKACCSELLVQPLPEIPGLFQVAVGDSYEAARLLLIEPWGALAETVKGELIVAAPTRDLVLYAGSEDQDALMALAIISQQAAQDAYGLSGQLYRWTPEGWVPLEPQG